MYPLIIATLLASTVSMAQASASNDSPGFQQRFNGCQELKDDIARLRCYDALAVAGTGQKDPNRQRRVDELDDLVKRERSGMLQSDDPNYFVYTNPIDDDINDEHHAEFYLSIKYPLVERTVWPWTTTALPIRGVLVTVGPLGEDKLKNLMP